MRLTLCLLLVAPLAACSGGSGQGTPRLAAPAEGGLALAGETAAPVLTLRPCSPGEALVRQEGAWRCVHRTAHAHPELAEPGGVVNAPGNPLHWTRLRGVPADWAGGQDRLGVVGVQLGWGITGTAGGSGQDITVAVDYGVVAPAVHGHAPDCPAVEAGRTPFTRRVIGRSVLCIAVIEAAAPLGVQAATALAAYHGAHACTLAELQAACDTGYVPTTGAWLGDRTGDDLALFANGTSCGNLDGESQVGVERPAHVCLRLPIR